MQTQTLKYVYYENIKNLLNLVNIKYMYIWNINILKVNEWRERERAEREWRERERERESGERERVKRERERAKRFNTHLTTNADMIPNYL